MLITKVKCPSNKIEIKCPFEMKPEGITVHNTFNDASAMSEISYMLGNDNEVSFHYAVDDYRAVQGIEENRNAWHSGDGANGKGNRKTIAIEICYSKSGGDKFIKAEENAVELIVDILNRYGWGVDKVTKHQDYSGKYCPHRTLDIGWGRFIEKIENKLKSTQKQATEGIDVYYKVKTQKHGWLGEVKNLTDYAGWENSPITDVAIKVSKGSVKYRVHVKGGGWLDWITEYNINDRIKGYAGNGKPIDAIQIYYYTPSDVRPYKKAKYKVNNYDWQYDTETTNNQDGFGGVFGKNITKLQIEIK